MSKITASSDIQQVKPEDVARYTDLFCQDVTEVVNGKLSFADNFDGKSQSVTFSLTATDMAIQHGLGRVPTGYIITSATAAMKVYSGNLVATSDAIYLRSDAVGTVTLLIY